MFYFWIGNDFPLTLQVLFISDAEASPMAPINTNRTLSFKAVAVNALEKSPLNGKVGEFQIALYFCSLNLLNTGPPPPHNSPLISV